jgi:hypothetical protein
VERMGCRWAALRWPSPSHMRIAIISMGYDLHQIALCYHWILPSLNWDIVSHLSVIFILFYQGVSEKGPLHPPESSSWGRYDKNRLQYR